MNRILIIILYFITISIAEAQPFTREQILGTWTSTEISFTKAIGRSQAENATIEKARRGLINSKFIFKPNGLFSISLPANAPAEFRELETMNNKMWHIRSKENKIFVGSLDEDLMMIDVKVTNGSYYFMIEDTPLILKMERTR